MTPEERYDRIDENIHQLQVQTRLTMETLAAEREVWREERKAMMAGIDGVLGGINGLRELQKATDEKLNILIQHWLDDKEKP